MITKTEAYLAMYKFLEAYFIRGNSKSDDIGILLGSMQLDESEIPFDSALEEDWDVVIKEVIQKRQT